MEPISYQLIRHRFRRFVERLFQRWILTLESRLSHRMGGFGEALAGW